MIVKRGKGKGDSGGGKWIYGHWASPKRARERTIPLSETQGRRAAAAKKGDTIGDRGKTKGLRW